MTKKSAYVEKRELRFALVLTPVLVVIIAGCLFLFLFPYESTTFAVVILRLIFALAAFFFCTTLRDVWNVVLA